MTVNIEIVAIKDGKQRVFYVVRKLHLETLDVLHNSLTENGYEIVTMRIL